MRIARFLFLAFLGFASEVAAETLTWDQLPVVQRRGQLGCWIRFEWNDRSQCVPRAEWWKMLSSQNVGLTFFRNRVLPKKEFEDQALLRAVELESQVSTFRSRLHHWLEIRRENLSTVLENGDHWGMFRALLLAEGASAEPLALLRLGGWVHVSSLAGIHLYGALTLLEVIMAWLFGRVLGLRNGWVRGLAELLTWTLGGMAWALQGFRWGFIRPFAVFMLRRTALRMGFRFSTLGPLVLVIGLELLLSSKIEFHGIWHYTLAVGGGLIALETWQKASSREYGIRSEFYAHLVMSLGSWTPIAMVGVLSTGLCAPWTFLQSLLSVTACSAVWVPIAILCLLLYWIGFAQEATQILSVAQDWIYAGMGVFHHGFSPTLIWLLEPKWFLAGVCIVILLLFGRLVFKVQPARLAVIGVLLSLGIRWGVSLWPSSHTQESIVQWDVRQGDSALVRVNGQSGMIDVGSARAVRLSEWMERLAGQRVLALDWILLTHSDEDHRGGLENLRLLLPVRRVIEGPRAVDPKLPFHTQFLTEAKKANGEMWGAWVELKNGVVYLNLGDADRAMERRFARSLIPAHWRPEQSPVRILKVSHHGSATSTDPELLARFRPTDAWISSGNGNHFGHPRLEILRRLAGVQARLFRTDQEGDLVYKSGQ